LEISLISLKIHHKTTYHFNKPVALGPHRLMLRPRESRDLRLISSHVTVTPESALTWAHDVFGNAVATATFQTMTNNLVIDSVTELQLDAAAWPVFSIAASAIVYPFRYSDDEWTDLGALTRQQYPDPMGRLRDWARAFVRGQSTDTLSLLKDLSASVTSWIRYQSRDDEGTQPPIQTLDRGWGSCRDFAVLFADAVRSLGSARVSSLAISTIPISKASDRVMRDRPTHGQRFLSRAQAGSLSIRPIAASAASI
jgi:transglutaminase-like putative cysteine protease